MAIASYYRLLALFFIIICINSKENDLRKINKVSQITLTIIGTGKQHILRDDFSPLPSELYINGNREYSIFPYIDNLNNNLNTIIMKWNDDLTDCYHMFFDDSNITEIDLSQFVTSSIISMAYMFSGLSNITSLNLSNFDTTSVQAMNGMFRGCKKLLSLNLSSFDTPLITDFGDMFNSFTDKI